MTMRRLKDMQVMASRTFKSVFLIGSFAFLAACSTVQPAPEPSPEPAPLPLAEIECPEYWMDARAVLPAWIDVGAKVTVLEGEYRSGVVATVNRQEPPTNWKPEIVAVYQIGGMAALVFQTGDCMWTQGPVNARVLVDFINAARENAT
jgi:hypothetical protein